MSGRRVNRLFDDGDGHQAMLNSIATACKEADSLPEERLLNTDPDRLIVYFIEKYRVEVPKIDQGQVEVSHHERPVEMYDGFSRRWVTIPGEAYDFEVPFDGQADIFRLRPDQWDTMPPAAVVRGNRICFTVSDRSLSPEAVKASADKTLTSIENYLTWHRNMWKDYETQLGARVSCHIKTRRERLLAQKSSAARLAEMGFKLKEKPGDARTYVPPAVKKKVDPQLPPMRPHTPPDPTLDMSQYETILGIMRGAGRSIEQSASRTRELGEETLRDLFLVALNAHFGKATGEAFNHNGKTDILIRHESGNLFVAEFKIWGGDKILISTIDQLLSYMTWRDTKAAIVIFSRNVGFSSIIDKIITLPKAHSAYVAGPTRLDETSFQFVFALPQDTGRHATVSILAFDLGRTQPGTAA